MTQKSFGCTRVQYTIALLNRLKIFFGVEMTKVDFSKVEMTKVDFSKVDFSKVEMTEVLV